MKISRYIAWALTLAIITVLATPPTVLAGQGLEDWPIDSSAQGDKSKGQLTIYYKLVEGVTCQTCPEDPFVEGQQMAKMLFFLNLHNLTTDTWHLITAESDRAFCLTYDIATGAQQAALLDFLNGPVLEALNGDSDWYEEVSLKKVKNFHENYFSTSEDVSLYSICATIVIVAQ